MKTRVRRREPGDRRRDRPCELDEPIGDSELAVSLKIEAEVDVDACLWPDARAGDDTAGEPVVDDDLVPLGPGDEPPCDRDVATTSARERGVSDDQRLS